MKKVQMWSAGTVLKYTNVSGIFVLYAAAVKDY